MANNEETKKNPSASGDSTYSGGIDNEKSKVKEKSSEKAKVEESPFFQIVASPYLEGTACLNKKDFEVVESENGQEVGYIAIRNGVEFKLILNSGETMDELAERILNHFVGTRTALIFIDIMREYTAGSKVNFLLDLDEWAEKCGYSDIKQALKYANDAISFLTTVHLKFQLELEHGESKETVELEGTLFTTRKVPGKHSIQISFTDVADMFFSSQYAIMTLSNDIFKLVKARQQDALFLNVILSNIFYSDELAKNGTNDRVRVSTLVQKFNLPSLDSAEVRKRGWWYTHRRRIEAAFQELESTGILKRKEGEVNPDGSAIDSISGWDYGTGGINGRRYTEQELIDFADATYSKWEKSVIFFDLAKKADQTERRKKKEERKKAIEAKENSVRGKGHGKKKYTKKASSKQADANSSVSKETTEEEMKAILDAKPTE